MLDFAGTQFDGRHAVAAEDLGATEAEIAGLGFRPPQRYGVGRSVVCGAAERVSVRDTLENDEAGKLFLRRICSLVGAGIPVNLSPQDFGRESSGIDSWQRFCELIRSELSSRALSARHLGVCIHSHQLPLEAYCLIADVVLGRGPRYVFLDSLQMLTHGSPDAERRAEANWSFLWRHCNAERPVMPVYGGIVRSACPLLSDEVAATVLPGAGLHCPLNSAWLPITLPITEFAGPEGRIRWSRLLNATRNALAAAEKVLDHASWPDPAQQADARQNRRLAVEITGIGDLVLRRGDDPTSLECLNSVLEVAARIRAALYEQSAKIAARSGPVPALAEADPVGQWRAGPHRDSWSRHWQDALRRSAVRHRNLLVISPYAVIPAGETSSAGFSDLLPVIGLADAWSFGAPADFKGWTLAQFRHFHRRARAIIQRSH
jgi:hypothetical protein